MEALLVNATSSLQLRDRITCISNDTPFFLGRRLRIGRTKPQWSAGVLRAQRGAAEAAVDQKELDKQRAAMREWWLAQLAAKNGAATSGSKAPPQAVSTASKKVVAAKVEVSKSVEQDTIEKELERERAKREAREAEEKRTQQKVLDKGRKEMRNWWLSKLEAKKRSLGWEPYEPCWVLAPAEGSIATESYELTGEGVIVGAVPQTSYDEKPTVIDLDVVSSNHAKVYGKDVVAGFGKFTREYFVRDLGSTNGTFLNNLKLRPKTDVKLSPGDVLRFANEKATFVVKKGSRS